MRAYERENQESLLDGHVRAFAFFGAVPRRCAYDNLKSVVISVGKGRQRTLTRQFRELRSHYLFRTRFCNVARAHEKGHVENLVQRAQRRFTGAASAGRKPLRAQYAPSAGMRTGSG